MRPKVRVAVTVLVTALAAVGAPATVPPSAQAAPATRAAQPRLTDSHPCPEQPGFTCSTLRVPFDHRGRVPGTLALQVAAADNVDAPRGVLFFVSGGPGQPGVPFAARIAAQRLPELAQDYRFVTLDQRGTGEFGAIDCPLLQAQVGSSDIVAPTAAAVRQCTDLLRRTAPLYGTDQTVEDFDLLRQALGVDRMVLDGVSYGSFTAARYAIAHPRHVQRLVLDSVLPHHATAADSLYLTGLHAEARVLRDACATAPACGFDPAADLAWVVRHRSPTDGVRIFDTIVTYEFLDPTYRSPDPTGLPAGSGDLVGALHEARGGAPARLDTLVSMLMSGGDPVASFSSGLHAAALCADMRFPWGDAATPRPLRGPLLAAAERRLTARQVWPYTPEVATAQGFIQTCLRWPEEPPTSNPPRRLPDVPVLLVNGDRDLSTPLEWARQEAATARHATLVVVKGAAHSIQNRERGHAGRDAVIRFLRG